MEADHHSSATLLPRYSRFLHIVNELTAYDRQATTAFLYLTEEEFSALSETAKEVLARRKVANCPTSNAFTNPFFTPMSLTRTPDLMLDHRKPLPCQHDNQGQSNAPSKCNLAARSSQHPVPPAGHAENKQNR